MGRAAPTCRDGYGIVAPIVAAGNRPDADSYNVAAGHTMSDYAAADASSDYVAAANPDLGLPSDLTELPLHL